MRLAENVVMMPIGRGAGSALHLVLVWDDKNRALIDAGVPGQIDDILKAMEMHGFRPEDLTHLIITHQDFDHVGTVPELLELAPGMEIIAHAEESPYIDGRRIPIKLEARLAKYDSLPEGDRRFVDEWKAEYEKRPIKVGYEVHDSEVFDICGGLEFLHVPGHTPGHIAVRLIKSGIIVCGDAANIADGKLVGANPVHTQDMTLADRSLEKIKGYDMKGYVTYHGGYIDKQPE